MNKIEWTEALCFAGLRLMAVAMLLFGGLQFLFAVMDVWYRFDPNYFGAFFSTHLLRPLIVLLAGGLLYGLSARIAGGMVRSLRRSGS